MRVLLTGATGMVGRALARRLRREGHAVTAAVRNVPRSRDALGPEIDRIDLGDNLGMQQAVEDADAVIHLAGEPIIDRPWTEDRKRSLYDSRVGLTGHLAKRVRQAEKPPAVFICASAVGYYADLADTPQDESSPPADSFLGELCAEWERAAHGAESDATRVVCVRLGIVLDGEGGALAKMLPAFRLGLAGRLGDGQQYMSWIHLDDLLGVFLLALERSDVEGPVNATAPAPVTNAEFTRTLASLLKRPARLPVPTLALRLALGQRATLLTASQRAVPRALERAGYDFAFPTLSDALGEILTRQRHSASITALPRKQSPAELPGRASHLLEQETLLNAPLSEVFEFFSRPENLSWLTPDQMAFAIEGTPPSMAKGACIVYRIKLGLVPMRWQSRIVAWQPETRFVDHQESGPYALWWHEHHFEAEGESTRVRDRVYYRLPLGWLGRWLAGGFVRGSLQRIFGYRAQAMAQRFGSPLQPPAAPGHSVQAAE